MPRKRKHNHLNESILSIYLIMVGGIASIILLWFTNSDVISCNLAVFLILAIIIGTPIAFTIHTAYEIAKDKELKKGLLIADIDSMTGIEFEQYLEELLTNQGYIVNTTQTSGDLGVDLIASRDGDKIAIQAKRYSTNVSRRAISDAVAGMYHYNCNKAMVITNSYFSPGAKELAVSTGCVLIDREILAKWINEFQSSSKANQNRAYR